MQLGVVFPQYEVGADLGGVRAYAQAAQDLGFEYLITADHVLGADPAHYPGWDRPYKHDTVIHEPMVLFAHLAAVAPKLGFMPNVIILPQRQAVLVAKQAAELDLITEGKLRLGVGIGWSGMKPSAIRAARLMAGSADPPIQIGIGRCCGRGQMAALVMV